MFSANSLIMLQSISLTHFSNVPYSHQNIFRRPFLEYSSHNFSSWVKPRPFSEILSLANNQKSLWVPYLVNNRADVPLQIAIGRSSGSVEKKKPERYRYEVSSIRIPTNLYSLAELHPVDDDNAYIVLLVFCYAVTFFQSLCHRSEHQMRRPFLSLMHTIL